VTERHLYQPDDEGICTARVVSATDVGLPFVCGMEQDYPAHFSGYEVAEIAAACSGRILAGQDGHVVFAGTTPVADPSETLSEEELQELERACRGESDCGLAGWYGACSPEAVLRLAAEVRRHRQSLAMSDHETLALMAEHELLLSPTIPGGWGACKWKGFGPMPNPENMVRYGTMATWAEGATIGDAVRACVARIKERGER
jgi:hypothetical protein